MKPIDEQSPDDELTLDQVAEILDAPKSFVRNLVARDAIPFDRPERGIGRFRADART